MTQLFVNRKIKTRIRELVANEMRARIAAEVPGYAETESAELQNVWSQYVNEIADQIYPRRS